MPLFSRMNSADASRRYGTDVYHGAMFPPRMQRSQKKHLSRVLQTVFLQCQRLTARIQQIPRHLLHKNMIGIPKARDRRGCKIAACQSTLELKAESIVMRLASSLKAHMVDVLL